MAKKSTGKKKLPSKISSDVQKRKNNKKQVLKRKVKRNSGKKGKNKRADSRKLRPSGGVKYSKLQKAARKKLSGRIRDFRGQFIEKHYESRLRSLKKELITTGAIVNGKKVTKRTSFSDITKAIYDNKLFGFIESQEVSYFEVIARIIKELEVMQGKRELIVKIKPFFKDWRVFNIKYEKREVESEKRHYFTQATIMNKELASLIDSQSDLIDSVIRSSGSDTTNHYVRLSKIPEVRYSRVLEDSVYALEYDYNKINPWGMSKAEFLDRLNPSRVIKRVKENLSKFDEVE